MELDFTSIRALSSRTRIRILKELLRERMTPSGLGERLDASTSDVVLHLETLSNAGLVQEEPGDGFNTVYAPTDKAQNIVDNGTAQVTFSVGSSAIAGLLGVAAVGQGTGLLEDIIGTGRMQASMEATQDSLQQAPGTTDPAQAAGIDPLFLVAGIAFVALSASLLYYGINIARLR